MEKRFSILCEIVRAQHFAWREAVAEMCPDVDPADVAMKMWEVTGHQTARAYLKRIDPTRPLASQIAHSIAWSSQSMGERAVVEIPREAEREDHRGSPGCSDEAFVRHLECPWFGWHERLGLLPEDRPGCDVWFRTIVNDVNESLGTNLKVRTLDALPDGGPCCLRRLWVEEDAGKTSRDGRESGSHRAT